MPRIPGNRNAGPRALFVQPGYRRLWVAHTVSRSGDVFAGVALALLVLDHLRLRPIGYGLLLAAIGVGAVLGPVVLTRLVINPRRPGFVFGPYLLRGTVDVALATFTGLPATLAALAAYGL